MAGLLLSIDVNDKGTAKVQAFQQAVGRVAPQAKKASAELKTMGGLSGSLSAKFGALAASFASIGMAKSFIDAGIEMQRINNALTVVTGSAQAAKAEFDFLSSTADRLGTSVQASANAYASLTAAAKGTSMEGEKTRDLFTSISEASVVLGLSYDQTQGALKALEQMISKGNVQAEELRGQLGERLPGAFNLAARAMNVSTQELNKMLKDGDVLASDLLPKLSAEIHKTFGKDLDGSMNSLQANINRLKNSWFELRADFMSGTTMDITQSIVLGLKDAVHVINNLGAVSKSFFGEFAIRSAVAMEDFGDSIVKWGSYGVLYVKNKFLELVDIAKAVGEKIGAVLGASIAKAVNMAAKIPGASQLGITPVSEAAIPKYDLSKGILGAQDAFNSRMNDEWGGFSSRADAGYEERHRKAQAEIYKLNMAMLNPDADKPQLGPGSTSKTNSTAKAITDTGYAAGGAAPKIEYYSAALDDLKSKYDALRSINDLRIDAGEITNVEAAKQESAIQKSILAEELKRAQWEAANGDNRAQAAQEVLNIEREIATLGTADALTAKINAQAAALDGLNNAAADYENALNRKNDKNSILVELGQLSSVEALAQSIEGERQLAAEKMKAMEYERSITGEVSKQRQLDQDIKTLSADINDKSIERLKIEQALNSEIGNVLDSAKTENERLQEQIDSIQMGIDSGVLDSSQISRSTQAIGILKNQMIGIPRIADGIGDSFANAFSLDRINEWSKGFSEALGSLLKDIANVIYEVMVLDKIKDAVSSGVTKWGNILASSASLGVSAATGGGAGAVTAGTTATVVNYPNAKGNVFDQPMYFTSGGRRNVMAEAGPEAVMPLARDSKGRLGVSGGGSNVSVNIINKSGGEVTTSETTGPNGEKQLLIKIEKALARSVSNRGALAQVLERQYKLQGATAGR